MIGRDVRKGRQAPHHACLLLSALTLATVAPSYAQGPGQAAAPAQTYAADYFTPFNPVTAEDMIRRLPGFNLDTGDDRRGFH